MTTTVNMDKYITQGDQLIKQDALTSIERIWMQPAISRHQNREEAIKSIQKLVSGLSIKEINFNSLIFNNSSVDISLLRFYTMCTLAKTKFKDIEEKEGKLGFLIIETKYVERPYQVFFSANEQEFINVIIRGATTDQLLATGRISSKDNQLYIDFTGESDWHKVMYMILENCRGIILDRIKKAIARESWEGVNWKVCIDTYTNIGHALQNEIGPVMLVDNKLSLKNEIIARKHGPYDINAYYSEKYPNKKVDKFYKVTEVMEGIYIYEDCIIPTGSNPYLGMYAAYKLRGSMDNRIGERAKTLRNYLLRFNEVVYISPRLDTKRGVCSNQDKLICNMITSLKQKARMSKNKIAFIFEKLWYKRSEMTDLHNDFVEQLIENNDETKSDGIVLISLPKLQLHEKLYITNVATTFIGAGGANFCTFFDWQGNEVPGIIYGDEDLMEEGGYKEEFLNSPISGMRVAGRSVISGKIKYNQSNKRVEYSLRNIDMQDSVINLTNYLEASTLRGE